MNEWVEGSVAGIGKGGVKEFHAAKTSAVASSLRREERGRVEEPGVGATGPCRSMLARECAGAVSVGPRGALPGLDQRHCLSPRPRRTQEAAAGQPLESARDARSLT